MTLLLAAGAVCATACQRHEQAEQNIIVDNGVMANAEIEALPADESSATPADELANGADNPDVNDLDASTNAH